jgi:hypothetical protein
MCLKVSEACRRPDRFFVPAFGPVEKSRWRRSRHFSMRKDEEVAPRVNREMVSGANAVPIPDREDRLRWTPAVRIVFQP